MLYTVVLTLESVDEILKCDHSNEATEQYFPVVLFIMLFKVVLKFLQQYCTVSTHFLCEYGRGGGGGGVRGFQVFFLKYLLIIMIIPDQFRQ